MNLYPRHAGFELKFDCEQVLNMRTSRVLLTYEKISMLTDDQSVSESEVHTMRNGFRDLYFKPTKPGADVRSEECRKK